MVNPKDVDIIVDRDDRKSIIVDGNQENYLTLYLTRPTKKTDILY